MIDKSSNFCVLPWIGLNVDVDGRLNPCCKYQQELDIRERDTLKNVTLKQAYNSERWQSLRKAFLNGEQPVPCKICWEEEKSGVESYRQHFLNTDKVDYSFVDFNQVVVDHPLVVDLKLNNVCNLKCRICNPYASSTYGKEYQQLYNTTIDLKYFSSDKIFGTENEKIFTEWAKFIQHIEMSGGEPMTSPENVRMLKMFSEVGDIQNKTISINTNVTHWNDTLINYLTKFKLAKIHLSIDDLGFRQEYHRYPSEWNVIEKNVDKYLELGSKYPNIQIILFCTVSIYNIYYIPEYETWRKNKNAHFFYNLLHHKSMHSIRNLPESAKEHVRKKLAHNFPKIINFLNLPQEHGAWGKFLEELTLLDNHRQQNFQETFPEWAKIIGIS